MGLAWAYFRFFHEERPSFDCQLRFEEEAYHFRKTAFGTGPHARQYIERVAARRRAHLRAPVRGHRDRAGEHIADPAAAAPARVGLIASARCGSSRRARPFSSRGYETGAEQLFAASVDLMIGGPHMLLKLRKFFVRDDPSYEHYAETYQARTPAAKAFYLFMHFLPGIFAVVTLNIRPVFVTLRDLSGLDDRMFQYVMFIVVTYGWHTLMPVVVLMRGDKLSFRQTMAYLSLDRVDWKGLLLVLPAIFVPYTIVSIPWFRWVKPAMTETLESFPALQLPAWSLFRDGGGLYDFPPFMLIAPAGRQLPRAKRSTTADI